MKFTPISNPLSGERSVAVEPTPAPQVDATWQRQRFTTGRSVSAPALIEEQDHRAGRATLLSQGLRPGVIHGLEAEVEGEGSAVTVAPGLGLCANGQDVTVARAMRVRPAALPVRLCGAVSFPQLRDAGPEPELRELLLARQKIAVDGLEYAIDPDIVAAIPSETLLQLVQAVFDAESTLRKAAKRAKYTTRFSASEVVRSVELTGTSLAARSVTSRASAIEGLTSSAVVNNLSTVNNSVLYSASVNEALVNSEAMVDAAVEGVDLGNSALQKSEVYAAIREAMDLTRVANTPQVCVLVLEPAEVEQVGAGGPTTDPCERDVEAEPFEDRRRVDATRAVWIPIEALFSNARDAADWLVSAFSHSSESVDRNRLIWALFNAEDALDGAPLPWSEGGVPVALAAFAHDGHLLWLDRASVARRGGHHGDRSELLGSAGAEVLWQARVEQFNEQLAGLPVTLETSLKDHLRWLPPAGALPPELVDLRARKSPLFPSKWGVSAVPVPIDQLDAVVRGSAALAPFDLHSSEGDELRLLVPVRREVWEPGLLRVESVPPDFHAALDEAEGRRDAWLRRRAELRAKLSTLRVAVGGMGAALSFSAEEGDEQAERIASQVLWDNSYAMSLIQELSAQESGPLLADLSALNDAAEALLGAGFALRAALAEAVDVADPEEGALAVVGVAAGETGALIQGPSRAFLGGWTHPLMAGDDGRAVLRDLHITVVAGTLDTEALDRAVAQAGGAPLLILAEEVSPIAAEDLIWMHHRGAQVPVVVKVLPTESGEDVAESLRAARSQLALRKRPNLEEYYSEATCAVAVVDHKSAMLIDAAAASAPLGAAVLVPADDEDDVAKARFALELLLRLRAVDDATAYDDQGLLRALGGSRNPYGTYPESTGLYPLLLDELSDKLDGLRAPQPGGYGSSAPLTDAQLQDPDVAYDRPRVYAEGMVTLFADIGLDGFIAQLEDAARSADDLVDFSFLQVQTSTFRVREHMLGRDKALRMASSPVLADLADLVKGDDSPEQLANFFSGVRAEVPETGGTSGTPVWLAKATKSYTTRDLELHSGTDSVYSEYLKDYRPETEYALRGTDEVVMTDLSANLGAETQPKESVTEAYASGKITTDGARDAIASGSNVTYDRTAYTGVTEVRTAEVVMRDALLGSRFRGGGFGFSGEGHSGASGAVEGEGHSGAGRAAEGEAHASPRFAPTSTMYRVATPTYIAPIRADTLRSTVTHSVSVDRMLEVARKVKAATPVGFSLRTTGIFERVERSRAVEARQSAFRLRATVTQSLYDLDLHLDGVRLPGFIYGALPSAVQAQMDAPLDAAESVDLNAIVYAPIPKAVVAQVLSGAHDVLTADDDAGAMYSDAVRSLETTAATLRIIEGRVGEVRDGVRDAERTRSLIVQMIRSVEAALSQVEDELAEARHDVSVTQALLSEEQERVDAVNARRAHVLSTEVPILVFHRARMSASLDSLPTHDLEPAFDQRSAIRAATQDAPPAPEELREMVELLRDAPASWLRRLAPSLQQLDRLDALRRTLELSQERAARAVKRMPNAPSESLSSLRGRAAVGSMVARRKRAVVGLRHSAASYNLSQLSQVSWKQAQVQARRMLSVGDLIDGSLVPAQVSRLAASELELIYRVAAHLYTELGQVAPQLRSEWTRRLSEHDRPVDLRELSSLPGWSQVGTGSATAEADPFRKRELQLMVSWLHARVDADEDEAVAMVNDLVRVCVLLASHAPVGQILSGHVDEPTPLRVGGFVPVRIDPSRLRVGMAALLMVGSKVGARAVVEDLGSGRVMARVVSTSQAEVVLDRGALVRFIDADGVTFPDGGVLGALSAVGPRLLK